MRHVSLLAASTALTVMASATAGATTYVFSVGGFDEGAVITGTFTGEDTDLSGQIEDFGGGALELTDFFAEFSGNSIVPAFTLGFADLYGFVWSLDPLLGDDDFGASEGIGWDDGTYVFEIGPGPFGLCDGFSVCGSVSGPDGFSDTTEAVVVGGTPPIVPLPAPALLLFGALAGLGALRGYRAI